MASEDDFNIWPICILDRIVKLDGTRDLRVQSNTPYGILRGKKAGCMSNVTPYEDRETCSCIVESLMKLLKKLGVKFYKPRVAFWARLRSAPSWLIDRTCLG
jgi:hypothetical protein